MFKFILLKSKFFKRLKHEFLNSFFLFISPITLAWFGGTKFAQRPDYESFVINKKEYEEYGLYLCKHKFLNS